MTQSTPLGACKPRKPRQRSKPLLTAVERSIASRKPDRDWRFLSKMSTGLRKLSRKSRRTIDTTAEQLFALGLDRIRQALATPRRSARTAILFRDGLLLCFLITVPLRSGNAAALRRGIELLLDDDPRVELPAMKTILIVSAVLIAFTLVPLSAQAHCDAVDGPVG